MRYNAGERCGDATCVGKGFERDESGCLYHIREHADKVNKRMYNVVY